MISHFFIDRPIFAAVLSIVVTLAGAICAATLPLAQFPPVSPPNVSVNCNYPGASAADVASSVAAPIEQQVNGVEGMLYMSSSSTNDGSYSLTVTFKHGVDLNMAQVLVQNRVSLALPSLPEVIRQTGVVVKKRAPDVLMGLSINSPDGRYDQLYLSNFVTMQVKDEIARVEGVSDVVLMGQRDYSMRIWLDPIQLAGRNLTAGDVIRAVRDENQAVAAGRIGATTAADDTGQTITISALGRLQTPEQFGDIIVRADQTGTPVHLRDVARIELGAKNEDVSVWFDGKPTVFLPIFQYPDANALEVRQHVLEKMQELARSFPEGIAWEIAFDTAPYTRESIQEVVKTLRDAVILVALVVLLFLQNWRSAIIPLVAVPVAIVGTFAAMAMFGFSLNNLTLFGLVLAIGIVVDDAIVVVEAVEHNIEQGLAPREATIAAMHQVSGPVIAVGLVLSAVFVPCTFISGITGQFFRQFALTISVSTIISAFNSLTLSPALAALLLKPKAEMARMPLPWPTLAAIGGGLGWIWAGRGAEAGAENTLAMESYLRAVAVGAVAGALLTLPVNAALRVGFAWFNRAFDSLGRAYTWLVGHFLRMTVLVLVVYTGLLVLTQYAFRSTPRGFIPAQDMGYLLVSVQLPDASSSERTIAALRRIEQIAMRTPGVRHVTAIAGQSFALNAYGSNFGSMFVNLHDYPNRREPEKSAENIANSLRKEFGQKILEANVAVFPPPPVRGVGRAGGFTLMIEDRGDLGPAALQQETEDLVRAGNETPGLTGLFSVFRANVPQLRVEPNIRECVDKLVSVRELADTLRVFQGSLYVNDFNQFGRTWQVILQSEARYRDQLEDIPRLRLRNAAGEMVPIGSLGSIHEINGPLVITRYNMYPAASINGSALPGISSREALARMEKLAGETLPRSMRFEWTEMAYLELLAGNTAMILFGLAVVTVFLVLAAQYESWSLPLAVILVVPMCLLSAIVGVKLASMDINIFTQIGFVVLVGLASKNAILIVEYAKKTREAGASRREATLAACHLRLRPIVMTSLAFILGVLPLMLAQGAGAEMRRPLGTAVFAGMLGVTVFGVFLTPVFFFAIDWIGETRLARLASLGGPGQAFRQVLKGRWRLAWAKGGPPATGAGS